MNLNSSAARFKQVTFKKRIISIFLLSILIPFICLGVVSLYTINSIITNKVESSIQSSLKQELLAMENTLNNLNHVSQQIAFGGGTNRLSEQLQHETDPYELIRLRNEIKSELNVITFSNPNVGLTMYYYPDNDSYDFENFVVRDQFNPEQLPIMSKYPEITYYGPHKSYNRSINQLVFSTMRKVNLPEQNVYLYIETGFNATKNLFASESQQNKSRRLVILDNDGRIAFSQDNQNFHENSLFPDYSPEDESGTYGQYVWYKETSNQGWSIVSILPKNILNQEKNQWLFQMTGFFLIFVLAAVLMAWLLWKMLYKPLDKFNTEIKSFIQSNSEERTDLTFIPEFDYLLYQIRNMKRKIWELYGEIERKEKRRADLEVEKLLYQINPHFLMNTLDTVHWLAMMNGQEEIDKLVLSLNKLLNYNLGKMGEATTIGGEIQALKEYLQLQKIRYDFQFDVDIDVDDDAMAFSIPRFILQPLVENALYHGVSDDGYIHVAIQLNDELEITIQDNGAGMSQERIDQLLQDDTMESQKVGMGIGMKYVKRILEANYGEKSRFEIKSEIGKGTVVSLRVPVSGGN
ncbi:sensor histidine kinase [Paenibacillus qinlingensis]|uniref:sensor histidine kinase n=1 Tax=Paenibacillus qinlingensis TaxID=1837343 RepID=UPI0015632AA9|nr:sensor histidine kinase [Paenibacillus qinlingensis]NQX63655.1 histidine kinase [Paenibacillus qinlingensis]